MQPRVHGPYEDLQELDRFADHGVVIVDEGSWVNAADHRSCRLEGNAWVPKLSDSSGPPPSSTKAIVPTSIAASCIILFSDQIFALGIKITVALGQAKKNAEHD
jgi:hypothetical protein